MKKVLILRIEAENRTTARDTDLFFTSERRKLNDLNVGTETRGDDDIEKNLQKLIPDGWIGRVLLDASFNSPPNRLDDCETFVEFKTLASLAMTMNARAQQVRKTRP